MNSAAARAKLPMTYEEAVQIVQSSAFMVAISDVAIAVNTIVWQQYEVHTWDGRNFTFDSQPFRIIRSITRLEYYAALPKHMRKLRVGGGYFYEIATD
jgi:hypothetical protein